MNCRGTQRAKRGNAGEERQLAAARRSPRYLSFTGSLRDFHPGSIPSRLVFSETLPIEHRDIFERCLCNYGQSAAGIRGHASISPPI